MHKYFRALFSLQLLDLYIHTLLGLYCNVDPLAIYLAMLDQISPVLHILYLITLFIYSYVVMRMFFFSRRIMILKYMYLYKMDDRNVEFLFEAYTNVSIIH